MFHHFKSKVSSGIPYLAPIFHHPGKTLRKLGYSKHCKKSSLKAWTQPSKISLSTNPPRRIQKYPIIVSYIKRCRKHIRTQHLYWKQVCDFRHATTRTRTPRDKRIALRTQHRALAEEWRNFAEYSKVLHSARNLPCGNFCARLIYRFK